MNQNSEQIKKRKVKQARKKRKKAGEWNQNVSE